MLFDSLCLGCQHFCSLSSAAAVVGISFFSQQFSFYATEEKAVLYPHAGTKIVLAPQGVIEVVQLHLGAIGGGEVTALRCLLYVNLLVQALTQ